MSLTFFFPVELPGIEAEHNALTCMFRLDNLGRNWVKPQVAGSGVLTVSMVSRDLPVTRAARRFATA